MPEVTEPTGDIEYRPADWTSERCGCEYARHFPADVADWTADNAGCKNPAGPYWEAYVGWVCVDCAGGHDNE